MLHGYTRPCIVRDVTDTKDLTVQPGDIFYCSWGYDQTNVNFYKVVRVTPAGRCEVVPIGSHGVDDHHVVPNPDYVKQHDSLTGVDASGRWGAKPKTSKLCKMTSSGSLVLRAGHYWASRWTGKPLYQTAYGMGH